MPSQDDRRGVQPDQGPLAWLKQQVPALKPLLARGKDILALLEKVVVEQKEEPVSGPLFPRSNTTRVLPEHQARQPQAPASGPLFPAGKAPRAVAGPGGPAHGQMPVSGPLFMGGHGPGPARGQMPVSGPLFQGGNVARALPEMADAHGQMPVSGPLAQAQPLTTGKLSDTQLMNWPPIPTSQIAESATQRVPVVIKASMKRPAPAPPPLPPDLHKKRRMQMALVGLVLLGLITLLTLFTVTPLGHEVGLDWSGGPLNGSVLTGHNPGVNNPIAQATATAIYHRKTDGYDPSFYGSQVIGNGITSLVWPLGQCTYWSNYEYHRLTGFWVSWNGNADQWVTGAHKANWNVSQTPHVPSIMVMMPGVQGASGYGHVAVVESANGNVVHTSNMNWYANGGGWNRVSNVNFYAGRGIYFIWHT